MSSIIRLSDPDVFIEYGEEIAKKVKLINHSDSDPHYYSVDEKKFEDAWRNAVSMPAMLSICLESSFNDQKSPIQEIISGAYWFVHKEEKGIRTKKEVLVYTKRMLYDCLAYMINDSLEGLLPGFSIDNVRIAQVDNVSPNIHGYRAEFHIPVVVEKRLCYNPVNYNL